jgi:D-aminopeptidase
MSRQLIIYADMEGASGIFEHNNAVLRHGSDSWYTEGRELITSDVLAVCEAAIEFGIEDIMLYDAHFAGNPEHNVILERLPKQVRVFDVMDRCFDWRRIRGQACDFPFGIITVGQHARYGEKDAYFAHTIQSPPISSFYLNGLHVAELASAVLNFQGTRYLANIGCAASMKEARELCSEVACIPVKDKATGWEPSYKETYSIIKEGVYKALQNHMNVPIVEFKPPYEFSLSVCDGFSFKVPERISWKGHFEEKTAYWEAPSIEIGYELFNYVREYIVKD